MLCDGVNPCVVGTGFWQYVFEQGLFIFVCSKCGGMFQKVGHEPWWKSLHVKPQPLPVRGVLQQMEQRSVVPAVTGDVIPC